MAASNTVCYILKRHITDVFTEGRLLSFHEKRQGRKSFIVYSRDSSRRPNTCSNICWCEDSDVAPLRYCDYEYLCRINRPKDRYDVFASGKLLWAKNLKPGDMAYVQLQKGCCGSEACVPATFKWKGNTKLGLKFGVEISVSLL